MEKWASISLRVAIFDKIQKVEIIFGNTSISIALLRTYCYYFQSRFEFCSLYLLGEYMAITHLIVLDNNNNYVHLLSDWSPVGVGSFV